MAFPSTIDTFSTKVDGVTDVLAADINNLQNSVLALENKVGIDNSGAPASLSYQNAISLGFNMTWKSYTGTKISDAVYINGVGREIVVRVGVITGTNQGTPYFQIAGININGEYNWTAGSGYTKLLEFQVPAAGSYAVYANGGTISTWHEFTRV